MTKRASSPGILGAQPCGVPGPFHCRNSRPERRRGSHRHRRHWRRRDEREGAGSRRLGHRGNHGSADQADQDGRDRRPRPLPGARPAAGELRRLVPGYGLVDSPKVQSAPGKVVNLTAVIAPDARAAAEYYPANYWYALLGMPDKKEFPGTGPNGNGISEAHAKPGAVDQQREDEHVHAVPPDGQQGHAGNPEDRSASSTRPPTPGTRRLKSGIDGGAQHVSKPEPVRPCSASLATFADWTDRIAAGEYPREAPPRPQGVERNIVVTQWDWADQRAVLPRRGGQRQAEPDGQRQRPGVRRPREQLGPDEHLRPGAQRRHAGHHSRRSIRSCSQERPRSARPSPYWGEELYWSSRVIAHSNVLDQKGRAWNTSRTRPPANPDFCKEGSSHPSAKLFPLNTSGRQYTVYDPKTKQFSIVNTCFGTFHLNFAHDAQQHDLVG